MTARFMATTALVLSLALPAAAGAGQSAGIQQDTKVEQSTSATVSAGGAQLLADAKAQLHSTMTAMESVKDGAGDAFAKAKENAGAAIRRLETALDAAKAEIAETSRDAMAATRARIAEARRAIADQQSKPRDIASSLGSVDDAVAGVTLDSEGKGHAKAEGDTGIVDKVGSALGLTKDSAAAADGIVPDGRNGWQSVELVGKTLYGADQESVGEIDDVVMAENGEVRAVLVDVGGFLGLGEKTVAVPVDRLEVRGKTLVAAGLTAKQAEQMPEYQRQQ